MFIFPSEMKTACAGNTFFYESSVNILGFCSAIRSSAMAGPLGLRRLTPITPAKAASDNLNFCESPNGLR